MFCKLQVAPLIRCYILACYIQSESMLSSSAWICYPPYQHSWPCSRRKDQQCKIEGPDPNSGSNQLYIKKSEQQKEARLIIQSGIYHIFTIPIFQKAQHMKNLRPAILPRKVKHTHHMACCVQLVYGYTRHMQTSGVNRTGKPVFTCCWATLSLLATTAASTEKKPKKKSKNNNYKQIIIT